MSGGFRGSNGKWRPRRPDREAQRRKQQQAAREKLEDESFDPTPPTDDEYAIGDGPNMRRLQGPATVGDALGDFLARTGFADRVRTTRLLSDWEAIVGGDIAANAHPQRIERGVLYLVVASSTWATQLQWLEASIIEKVNAAAKQSLVHRLKVSVGDVERARQDRPDGLT